MKLKSLALAAMVALGGYAAAAQAAETPAGPHISTSGSAVIQAEPDMATLSINVTVKEKMRQPPKHRQINVWRNILIS